MDENTCLPTGSEAPTQTSNDLPRALTEFGQQAEVNPSRRPVLGVAINQFAIALLRLGRRLLNLNGGDPIRLRRINRDDSKIPVRIARSNGYCGLFSRGSGTILPSTNTDTRRPEPGSPGLVCSTFCSVARSPVELEPSVLVLRSTRCRLPSRVVPGTSME